MSVNKDFADLLHCLNELEADYLIVGAYAVIFYTEPRYTKDLDIWIRPDLPNAQKVYAALKRFGAPLKGLTIEDLSNSKLTYQIGMEPNRIDLLMGVDGLKFEEAWEKRRKSFYGKENICILSLEDLVKNKKKVGRLQDQIDVQKLKPLLKKKSKKRH